MKQVLAAVLILVLSCACLTAAPAEPGKLYLHYIGGDADFEECPNNVGRNIRLHHEELQDRVENFYSRSVNKDYSNATARKVLEAAEKKLSPDGINVVIAYSHGGQSVYFMDVVTDRITDVYLLDACVSVQGKGSDNVAKGRFWAEWVVDTAKKGVNVHLFASIGKHNEPSGAKNAIANLEKAAEKDDTLIPLGDGQYQALDENGNPAALIETGLLEGNHKTICTDIEDHIVEYLYSLLPE